MKRTENTTRANVHPANASNTTTKNGKEVQIMKTTNTTDKKALFTLAHKMTRATVNQYPDADYRTTFAAALKIAYWEAGKTAAEIFAQMTGDEQYTMLFRMTCYEYQHDERIINGKPVPGFFQWMRDRKGIDVADTLRAISHDAYIELVTALDNADDETPLSRLTSRAIHRAAAKVYRAEMKNARAIRNTTDPETGEERSVIDTKAGAEAARMDSPERAAEIADLIDRACKDAADRLVIADRLAGYTQTETAAVLNIGQKAVSKRLDGIRDRLAETIGRDPREKKAPRGKTARRA